MWPKFHVLPQLESNPRSHRCNSSCSVMNCRYLREKILCFSAVPENKIFSTLCFRVQGWPLTEFCRCEYLLARAQQNVRNWQQLQDESFLESAQEESSTAHDICEKKNFQEMLSFVNAELHEINVHLNSI